MEGIEDFSQMLEESLKLPEYKKGDIVKGKIVKFNDNIAFVDIGLKTEAVIPKDEVSDLEEGDEVEAIFTGKRLEGYYRLTRKPLLFKLSKEKIEKSYKEGIPINAKVLEKKTKGYIVEVGNLRVYLPISESGLNKGEELPEIIPVIIIRLEEDKGKIKAVASRKKAIEKEREEERNKLLETLEVGKKVKGKVVKLLDKGAVLSIDNLITGFLPNSLYSWDLEKTTRELKEGDEIEVIVKDIDREKGKILLSRKDLEPNPWEMFDKKVGDIVEGEIKNILDTGLIVKSKGITGFIHKSETDHLYPDQFKDKFKVGQRIKAKIIELDKNKKRFKLSIKEATPHPLEEFIKENPEGSVVRGKVKETKTKMAIIDLGNGIEGVLHLRDATWNPKIKTISQVLKGKKAGEFMVLGLDGNRVKVGLKQFKENPWEVFRKKYKKGDIVKAKVKKLIDRGAFVDILDEVEGFIPKNEITKEKIEIPSDKLKLGQEVEAKIIKIKGNDIILSIKAIEEDKEKKELEDILKKFKPKESSDDKGLATLGELLKKKLEKRGK